MVEAIVRRVIRELGLPPSETPDLMAYAFEGLVEARGRFDPTRGVLFRTFASYRVRGAVIDGVRKMCRLSRRAYERVKALEAADRVTEDEAYSSRVRGREAAIAAAVGTLDSTLSRLATSFVLAHAAGERQDDPSPEESLLRDESKDRLRAALEILDDRERALVCGYYFDGVPFDQTAKRLGISKSWASRIHTRALDRLRCAMLEEEGETTDAVSAP